MSVLAPTCSLRLGERLVVWSDGGLLEAEYALFDPSEIILHASDPVTVREAGYMTTAGQARARLAQAGVTMDLAVRAAKALAPETVLSFARSAHARLVIDQLGPQEVFDGAVHRSSPTPCYEGAWLDLRALVQHLELPSISALLQALHLAATLSEVADEIPVHLSTAAVAQARRPGERTHSRPKLVAVAEVPTALALLRPRTLVMEIDSVRERRLHRALVARVRERLAADSPTALRTHLTALEERLARGGAQAVDDPGSVHKAAITAARGWLAAGVDSEARRLALQVAIDPAAPDSSRLDAQELLAAMGTEGAAGAAQGGAADRSGTARPRFGLGDVPPPRALPALTDRPPPIAAAPRGGAARVFYSAELVESLPLPPGASESDLAVNDRPTTPATARIAMIRLARDLARDYRLWYGKALRCDVIAIDGMQQHLARRYVGKGASISDDAVAWELRRHGALLSEIVARKLGGAWIDVGPSEPGYWAMLVAGDIRTHPIGRVYRYVVQGQRERDLVSYFMELERRAREP